MTKTFSSSERKNTTHPPIGYNQFVSAYFQYKITVYCGKTHTHIYTKNCFDKLNMDAVIIRKAKREDCKDIRDLIQELADFERMPHGPKIDYTDLEINGFDTTHPLFICYVAEIAENLIGYAISYYTYSTWCGKAMYLEDLYVTPCHRLQCIGSKLLKAIAKEAVNNNCCRLDFSVLNWNPARHFYEYKGATDISTTEGWCHYRFSDKALQILAADS